MSDINNTCNTYALYPQYIMNQKELLVGCDEKEVKVAYRNETPEHYLSVKNMTGREPHIDSHYTDQLKIPLQNEILYDFPWEEHKYDKAYVD